MTNQLILSSIPSTMTARDLNALINHLLACDCAHPSPTRSDCRHDLRIRDMRDLLIDRTDPDLESDIAELLRDALTCLLDAPYSTEHITAMLLDNSLCPMHAIDYAICFDDDDPTCAAIRTIHPSHDT